VDCHIKKDNTLVGVVLDHREKPAAGKRRLFISTPNGMVVYRPNGAFIPKYIETMIIEMAEEARREV